MNLTYSVSEAAPPKWDYIRTGPGRSGRSLSENNFAKERRDWLSILLREVLQNALDARISPTTTARVSIQIRKLDNDGLTYVEKLVSAEQMARFKESVPHLADFEASRIDSCLVVEDFGTTGLTGVIDNPDEDGKGQNWNAFWFREGESGKENSSGNGGAGQGKITYFSTSAVRSIFAYTVRSDDGSEALFGASSFLRDYQYGGHKWKRDAYWGLSRGEGVDRIHLPVQSRDEIDGFCKSVGLTRSATESGLSLVIPSPKEFDVEVAAQIVTAEFYVPILRGDLIVRIGDVDLERSSISELADRILPDTRALALHTCTTRGYRGFLADSVERSRSNEVIVAKRIAAAGQLVEAIFDAEQLATMREALDSQKIVAVRFPLFVRPRNAPEVECSFDVFLEAPLDLDQPEQALIRRDLLIGEEPIGSGKIRQRVRGLTLISNLELSRLLLSAEEATHLRWNTRLPRLAEYYRSGADVVAIVRNAMAKLLDILVGGEQKRDFKLLSKFFSAPGVLSAAKSKGKKSQKGKLQPEPGPIPPAQPKLLAIVPNASGCQIRPSRADALEGSRFPIEVNVEFAYEGLDKDAYSEYHPLDFNLADEAFSIKGRGCVLRERRLNHLTFEITEPDFRFSLSGFDTNLRLRIRMKYEEKSDATTLGAE